MAIVGWPWPLTQWPWQYYHCHVDLVTPPFIHETSQTHKLMHGQTHRLTYAPRTWLLNASSIDRRQRHNSLPFIVQSHHIVSQAGKLATKPQYHQGLLQTQCGELRGVKRSDTMISWSAICQAAVLAQDYVSVEALALMCGILHKGQ